MVARQIEPPEFRTLSLDRYLAIDRSASLKLFQCIGIVIRYYDVSMVDSSLEVEQKFYFNRMHVCTVDWKGYGRNDQYHRQKNELPRLCPNEH
jgi:hypothetical protein